MSVSSYGNGYKFPLETLQILHLSASNKMAQLLHTKILQTYRVNQILSKDERMGIKSEAPQPDYDVVISVLNPKPKITNAKWNVVMAAQSKFV